MLYLHCGWPRTGTSSLQDALYRRRRDLGSAGTVFPLRWMSNLSPTHHGVSGMLKASLAGSSPFDELQSFLAANERVDVLLSAESITFWLTSEAKQNVLVAFLGAALEVVSVKCVWTLRRLDEEIRSLYLFAMSNQPDPPQPAALYRVAERSLDPLFAGLRRVGEAVDENVAYARYDPAGAHQAELLRAFGIGGPIGEAIRRELERRPRLNSSLSQKQAALLLNVEALSGRTGIDLDWAALRKAIREGRLIFESDRHGELVSYEMRRTLHENALTAARAAKFAPYIEFFADAEIQETPALGLDLDVLDDRDVERVVALCGGTKAVSAGADQGPG
ncbi:MAG: hypothetical protein WA687_06240 [Solirubrobacterales bacterium]